MNQQADIILSQQDAHLVEEVVNQGIDSRLTAFCKSKFEWRARTWGEDIPLEEWGKNKPTIFGIFLHCWIDPNEWEILIRRLNDLSDSTTEIDEDKIDRAGSLADDLVRSVFLEEGQEICP